MVLCGSLLVSTGCTGNELGVEAQPLGWGSPVEARETRRWSRESMDSVPQWTVADLPSSVVVSDPVESEAGTVRRYVDEAAFFPDGRVVLFFNPDQSKQDSILLHIFDPASGKGHEVSAPQGEGGRFLNWADFGMVTDEGGIVVMGSNRVGERREVEDIWYFDREGESRRPLSYVPEGRPLGVLPDGSLVIAGDWGSKSAGVFLDFAIMSVQPAKAGNDPARAHGPDTLFVVAIPKDPTVQFDYPARWGHHPSSTIGVAGDTIWIVPTEKPELLAVNRSGEVLLKVQWEAGDRDIPPTSPEFGRGAERYPAAKSLKIGTDGLLYVQQSSVRDGRPVRGPKWLVFNKAGRLLARLDVPGHRWVLAFGDGALVATAEDDETGLQEVRVHVLTKTHWARAR